MNKQMATKNRQADQRDDNGFAIPILPRNPTWPRDADRGDEDGHYAAGRGSEPRINEAKEIAQSDFARRARMRRDRMRETYPGLCPYEYKVWAQGIDGDYKHRRHASTAPTL